MAEQLDPRVAVYIDFDNIVISQYDHIHGRGSFSKDKARNGAGKAAEKLQQATVDIGEVLDFASSFGAVAISRAYADWAAPANTRYQKQLIDRAVDLVQLFNTAGTKNGADIRLAIDVVEDLFRLEDISHVVIVAGDSDYIPLAQRVRRMGRVVVGVGVTGSTSAAFKSACDEFSFYEDLVEDPAPPVDVPVEKAVAAAPIADAPQPEVAKAPTRRRASAPVTTAAPPPDPQHAAAELLVRALRVAQRADTVDGWVNASSAKQQMKRLDAGFGEKKLGFKSFTDFVRSVDAVETKEDGSLRFVRLK
ncbi:uncharacterized LabA/DUF88 family protein [Microbacteriaceae bacterium SG_E_30_P1]|uniref:Uncharacterized LabA/DUF88 family protein n=1 Tax=Antiquaquibacter oligotrophicus TaxID=2880260 RepID=A0ABT6KMU7_9MICO|nr:NYN domain-containing protein [Antiquaquibacter oligotrophicus]MDH6181334.1 uncharacterized LabA/DUF88 family protein [Antiquaquibacter oligotrophicus]UDF12973.1 NYN domain-containing protein [Antiquaquibacter oligotrophicus]